MTATRFRRPTHAEHDVLLQLVVRPLRPAERARFDAPRWWVNICVMSPRIAAAGWRC